MRVLILDDSENYRQRTKNLLETQGFKVSTATNNSELLSKLSCSSYDILLIDIGCLDCKNKEDRIVLNRLRNDYPNILMIGQTSMTDLTEYREECRGYFDNIRSKHRERGLVNAIYSLLDQKATP